MADSDQTFGEQAARFSLYAPFVALGIGIFLIQSTSSDGVPFALGILNLLIIIAGLILGIVSLFLMRQHNRRRILLRSVVGIVLNGFLAISAVAVFKAAGSGNPLKSHVVGHWRITSQKDAVKLTEDMTYNADGTFEMQSSRSDGVGVNMHGRWGLNQRDQLFVTPTQSSGNQSILNKPMLLGTVQHADDEKMILDTSSGSEISNRIK